MKKILITGLLLATSNAYSHDVDCDIIELDDFQNWAHSSLQYPNDETYHGTEDLPEVENEQIEDVLEEQWKNAYSKKGKQYTGNKLN